MARWMRSDTTESSTASRRMVRWLLPLWLLQGRLCRLEVSQMIDRLRQFFSPEQRRVIGQEAKQLLENRHFREAFEAVEAYLVETAKACDPDNKEKTQRVVIAMQIAEAVKREIVRKVEDGEMAQVEIAELDARHRPRRFER